MDLRSGTGTVINFNYDQSILYPVEYIIAYYRQNIEIF